MGITPTALAFEHIALNRGGVPANCGLGSAMERSRLLIPLDSVPTALLETGPGLEAKLSQGL